MHLLDIPLDVFLSMVATVTIHDWCSFRSTCKYFQCLPLFDAVEHALKTFAICPLTRDTYIHYLNAPEICTHISGPFLCNACVRHGLPPPRGHKYLHTAKKHVCRDAKI